MKQGQAAIDFLMDYGWAILVSILAIGALAYFGVLDPDQFLSGRCDCKDLNMTHSDSLIVGGAHYYSCYLTIDPHIGLYDGKVYGSNSYHLFKCIEGELIDS